MCNRSTIGDIDSSIDKYGLSLRISWDLDLSYQNELPFINDLRAA